MMKLAIVEEVLVDGFAAAGCWTPFQVLGQK